MSDDRDEIERIAAWHDRVERRAGAGAFEREVWIAAARQLFKPGERQPCWVCGKFQSITQAHHVVPLVEQYTRGFAVPDNEHVWLCPNHHAIAHLFIIGSDRSFSAAASRARSRRRDPVNRDLSEREFEKMIELMHMAARTPGW